MSVGVLTTMRRRTAETFGASVAILGLLLVRNRWVLTTPVLSESDFGANSIRIELAKHFEQLVGNYSRVGFDHPGPAFFYLQALSEWLFHDVVPLTDRPYNAQLLGILIVNAVLLATCAAIISLRTRRRINGLLLVGFVLLVVSAESGGVGQPAFLLTSNWMPAAYVVPFLTFLVAGASVLVGRFETLPIYAFACGLLVHGHVSFVAFVVPISLSIAAWVGWTNRGRHGVWRRRRRTLVVTAVIIAVFVLPIALETILHWPGEIPDYWHYTFFADRPHHSVAEAVRYVLWFWWRGPELAGALVFGAAVAAAVVLTLRQREPRIRRFAIALLVMNGLASLCFLNYARSGIDFLDLRYVSYFYNTVPATTYTVIGMNVVAFARARAHPVVRGVLIAGVAALCIAAVTAPGLANDYRGDSSIERMVRALRDDPRRDDRTVALSFGGLEWGTVMGVLDDGLRSGVPMCIATGDFARTVPARDVCDGAPDEWPVLIAPRDFEGPGDRVATGRRAVVVVQGPDANRGTSVDAPRSVLLNALHD